MADKGQPIEGRVEAWRDDGTWRIRVLLPTWVINDLMREQVTPEITNTGGGGAEQQVLLIMRPKADLDRAP